MRQLTLFITGTDTDVGKTIVSAAIAGHWHRRGHRVAALKPVCSGGRADARILRAACGSVLTLAEVNPWHFQAGLTPQLASRLEKRPLRGRSVLRYLRGMQRRFPLLVVEGAGGLRSPLGEDFDSRSLLVAIDAIPIVVCPNRLGAINQCLLVLDSLPRRARLRARIVLVTPRRADAASRTNLQLLEAWVGEGRVCELPWLRKLRQAKRRLAGRPLRQFLSVINRAIRP